MQSSELPRIVYLSFSITRIICPVQMLRVQLTHAKSLNTCMYILMLCIHLYSNFEPQVYCQQSLDLLSTVEDTGTMQLLRSLATVLLVSPLRICSKIEGLLYVSVTKACRSQQPLYILGFCLLWLHIEQLFCFEACCIIA